MSTQNNNNSNDWLSWIPIVVLFCIPYTWPVALFLLIRRLTGGEKKRRQSVHPYDVQRRQQSAGASGASRAAGASGGSGVSGGQSGDRTGAAAGKGKKRLSTGQWMTIAGGVVSAVFGLGFASELAAALAGGGLLGMAGELVPLLGFVCLGLTLLFFGGSRTRKERRRRKYLSLIGRRRTVPLEALVKVSGSRRRKVLDDLQELLDEGALPTGYLDLSRDLLVLSEDGIPDEEPAAPTQGEAGQDDNAILMEIKAVNDAIPDPVISGKIDRIGEITGKILDYQRRNPGKEGQLRVFLNYYLPTTLKILRSYAQLDAQGVEGENISAAKARIEGMMDKVVEGFETQLDQLFRDRAMDITSDVAVLEQMLEKDGLSGSGKGMTLGG